jgi:hypothetical protein
MIANLAATPSALTKCTATALCVVMSLPSQEARRQCDRHLVACQFVRSALERPVASLSPPSQARTISRAGFVLRAVGRLVDAGAAAGGQSESPASPPRDTIERRRSRGGDDGLVAIESLIGKVSRQSNTCRPAPREVRAGSRGTDSGESYGNSSSRTASGSGTTT